MEKRGQISHEPVQLGSDGELLVGKFCAYCGNRNVAADDSCQHCGAYIADQGPDRTARLARIRRRASAIDIDHVSPLDRSVAAQFERLDNTLNGLEQRWQSWSTTIYRRFVPIENRFVALRARYPHTMQLLFGHSSINTTSVDHEIAASEDIVNQRSSLSNRLSQVRWHSSRYSHIEWPEQEDFLSWLPIEVRDKANQAVPFVLIVGWIFGTIIALSAFFMALGHGFHF